MNGKMSRRQFTRGLGQGMAACGTASVLGLSSLRSLAHGALAADHDDSGHATLVAYAYCLLPVLEPAHDRYRAVADKVISAAAQAPGIAALLQQGIDALNSTGKGLWLNLPPTERVGIIKTLAGSPFFGYLHWITTETVMRDPALWAELGYQGSAIEHGGYLHRGFDDIDWLPKPGQEV